MKEILLKNGSVILVDDEDYEWASKNTWTISTWGYALRSVKNESGKWVHQHLHQVIGGRQNGMELDHINGNRLDNRKSNLRLITRQQNQMNKGKMPFNTSGHKGVYWNKQRQKWTAKINFKRRQIYLGLFDSKEDAAIAYRDGAIKHHGEFARIS